MLLMMMMVVMMMRIDLEHDVQIQSHGCSRKGTACPEKTKWLLGAACGDLSLNHHLGTGASCRNPHELRTSALAPVQSASLLGLCLGWEAARTPALISAGSTVSAWHLGSESRLPKASPLQPTAPQTQRQLNHTAHTDPDRAAASCLPAQGYKRHIQRHLASHSPFCAVQCASSKFLHAMQVGPMKVRVLLAYHNSWRLM